MSTSMAMRGLTSTAGLVCTKLNPHDSRLRTMGCTTSESAAVSLCTARLGQRSGFQTQSRVAVGIGAALGGKQLLVPGRRTATLEEGYSGIRVRAASSAATAEKPEGLEDDVPMPIVHIDQHTEANATIVDLQFGDRLGALMDTMKALRDLGLAVVKGTISAESGPNRFYITNLEGGKVEDPAILEQIRLVIINNLLQYHPESSDRLAMGVANGQAKKRTVNPNIKTKIHVEAEDGEARSLLFVETADRPGLLLEIIRVLSNLNIKVGSAEIDTEGFVAKDEFYVTYRDVALNSPMEELVRNALHYYLTTGDIEYEESY